ncbi:MAG: hypothetical protein KatS3mg111_2883 [Pirellulaceae bacterium]|nr:MAG: hypothetical protein KatS3mg111_2883 [Pirellulaceae bacterium]
MPLTYHGLGLELLYPDNWTVDESEALSVTIEAPGGAFFTVTRLPDPQQCDDAIEQLRRAIEEEYESVETEPSKHHVAERSLSGVIQQFFYLDLLITSHIMTISCPHYAWLIHYQAEDRDMQTLQPVFDALVIQIANQSP